MRRTNLCGRAQICRGAAGAGVWQRSAGAAAHWGGWSGASGSFWDAGGLSEDAVSLETSPRVAPAEEEPGQQLNLHGDSTRGKPLNRMNLKNRLIRKSQKKKVISYSRTNITTLLDTHLIWYMNPTVLGP